MEHDQNHLAQKQADFATFFMLEHTVNIKLAWLALEHAKPDMTILQQQDDPTERHQTNKIGAVGCVVQLGQPIEIGRFARLKMFIPEETAAVFCYAEVISCDLLPDLDVYQVSLLYTVIRGLDQEVLVRCTMHLQTQHLKARQTGAN
jgi:hypothetical protein